MDTALALARGPLLIFAFTLFALGVVRQVGLTFAELVRAYLAAGDPTVGVRWLLAGTLKSLLPIRAVSLPRLAYTAASVLFHAGLLVVPAFLSGHVQLIEQGLGPAWPALDPTLADAMTLATLAALGLLLLFRLLDPVSRLLSRGQDWLLPVLCGLPFLSGYLVAHPAASPLPFAWLYLIHLLSAELLLVLIPFTKLAHAALLPAAGFASELGWRFVPGAGHRVRVALGKEGEPV